MRTALALSLAMICCATSAQAWVRDVGKGGFWPPAEPDWDRDSVDAYGDPPYGWTIPGKATCEQEGRNILEAIEQIRADPGLLTRTDVIDGRDTGGHGAAEMNTKKWKYFSNWRQTRCTEVWRQSSDDPIDTEKSWTFAHWFILEGYSPVHHVQRGADPSTPTQVTAGTWDVRTGKGEHYVLTLSQDGRGELKTDNGGSGAVEGMLVGKQMLDLQYNLPDRSGEAIVTVKGDSFTGPDKAAGTAWVGMRLPGPAEPFGTWNVKTNRGNVYVLMLDRAGANLYGTLYVAGGAASPIGGSITGQTMYLTYGLPDGRSGHPILNIAGNAFSGYDPAPATPNPNMAQMGPEGWSGTRQ